MGMHHGSNLTGVHFGALAAGFKSFPADTVPYLADHAMGEFHNQTNKFSFGPGFEAL